MTTRKAIQILFSLILLAAGFPAFLSAEPASTSSASSRESPVRFWNRTIAVQRGTLAGITPESRAERASSRLEEIPVNASPSDIQKSSIKVEDQDGFGILYQGRVLFFLGVNDLDKESGEKLEGAADVAVARLREAMNARISERTWPVIRNGIFFAVGGFVLLILLSTVIWKIQSAIARLVRERGVLKSFHLFRFDLVPHLEATVLAALRVIAWVFSLTFVYFWVALSLRRFPYTEPWGIQASSFVFHAVRELAETVLRGLPGLLVVILIIVFIRWLIRMITLLLDQIASGVATFSWMDADVVRATQRICSAVLWVFGIIIAYPYIPGSQTEAFKGLSVFFGLVISLGSTGIINQIISGLFIVYSKALRTGEWVTIGETEGEVIDVGLLAAKVRTIEGQEVTVPNSLLVSTTTVNHTRLGHPEGKIVTCTVTIGYDVPWRQIHALLELAASRTPNLLQSPKPYVLQRQLSDFYVQYTLIARLDQEPERVQTISALNAAIQDAFNEFGVQIMSPHFMVQPTAAMTVPLDKWDSAPAPPLSRNQKHDHEHKEDPPAKP